MFGRDGEKQTEPLKTRVFISYSRKNLNWVDQFVAALKDQDIEVFIDREDIVPGEPWKPRIFSLINKADTVIFIISKASVNSEICSEEVGYADSLNKQFVPILLEEPVAQDGSELSVPEALARINYIDFTSDANIETSSEALLSTLFLDLNWVREHTRLGELAIRWKEAGKPSAQLLRGDDLEAAERWRDHPQENTRLPTELQLDFITASRFAQIKGQRRAIVGAVAVAIMAIGLAGVALWQWDIAVRKEKEIKYQFLRQTEIVAAQQMRDGDFVKAALNLEVVVKNKHLGLTNEKRLKMIVSPFQKLETLLNALEKWTVFSWKEHVYIRGEIPTEIYRLGIHNSTRWFRHKNLIVTLDRSGGVVVFDVYRKKITDSKEVDELPSLEFKALTYEGSDGLTIFFNRFHGMSTTQGNIGVWIVSKKGIATFKELDFDFKGHEDVPQGVQITDIAKETQRTFNDIMQLQNGDPSVVEGQVENLKLVDELSYPALKNETTLWTEAKTKNNDNDDQHSMMSEFIKLGKNLYVTIDVNMSHSMYSFCYHSTRGCLEFIDNFVSSKVHGIKPTPDGQKWIIFGKNISLEKEGNTDKEYQTSNFILSSTNKFEILKSSPMLNDIGEILDASFSYDNKFLAVLSNIGIYLFDTSQDYKYLEKINRYGAIQVDWLDNDNLVLITDKGLIKKISLRNSDDRWSELNIGNLAYKKVHQDDKASWRFSVNAKEKLLLAGHEQAAILIDVHLGAPVTKIIQKEFSYGNFTLNDGGDLLIKSSSTNLSRAGTSDLFKKLSNLRKAQDAKNLVTLLSEKRVTKRLNPELKH